MYFSGLLAAKMCTGIVERSCSALNTHSHTIWTRTSDLPICSTVP
jgi:hypothetical protein